MTESNNTRELMALLGTIGKLELFGERHINEVLAAYDKASIKSIIFHASGSDGVSSRKAGELVGQIIAWKHSDTNLYAVSNGQAWRTEMKKKSEEMRATKFAVDDYDSFLRKFKKKMGV
jgi:hypothetical protein